MSLAQAIRAEFDRLRESVMAEVRRYVDERLAELETPAPTTNAERLTVDQVCDRYNVARSTFYDWKADPQTGLAELCSKPGRRLLVDRTGFERWLKKRG